MSIQQPPMKQEIIYWYGADMSSTNGSVTVAVKPEAGVIVRERVCLTGGRAIQQGKPPARTFAVIRSHSRVSLVREPEDEPRTRHIDAPPAFGQARNGFTKLKTR
jgi:hypothetical protein